MTLFTRERLDTLMNAMDAFKDGEAITVIAKQCHMDPRHLARQWKRLGFDHVQWAHQRQAEQRERAVALYGEGLSTDAIAEHVGLSANTVRDILIESGDMPDPAVGLENADFDERCQHSVHMHRDLKMRTAEIADEMGASVDTVYRWWRAAGYDPKERVREERKERNARIAELFREGGDVRAIAETMGLPTTTVYSACVTMGLINSPSSARLGYPSAADVKKGKVPGKHLCPRCTIICDGDDPNALCDSCSKPKGRRKDALADFDSGWLERNFCTKG